MNYYKLKTFTEFVNESNTSSLLKNKKQEFLKNEYLKKLFNELNEKYQNGKLEMPVKGFKVGSMKNILAYTRPRGNQNVQFRSQIQTLAYQ